MFTVESIHQTRITLEADARFDRLRSCTGTVNFRLTVSIVVGEFHDRIVEAGARRRVLSHAAVRVQVKVVVFFGHVYAVAVWSGKVFGSAGLLKVTPPTKNDTNDGRRFQGAQRSAGTETDDIIRSYTKTYSWNKYCNIASDPSV